MDMSDLERSFYVAHPDGSFLPTVIKTVPAIKVQFKPGSQVYTYKGSPDSMFKQLKLHKIRRQPQSDQDGRYECEVDYGQDRFFVEYITVMSPFTLYAVRIREGWSNGIEQIWKQIRQAVAKQKVPGATLSRAKTRLTLEELRLVKKAYDRQMSSLAGEEIPDSLDE